MRTTKKINKTVNPFIVDKPMPVWKKQKEQEQIQQQKEEIITESSPIQTQIDLELNSKKKPPKIVPEASIMLNEALEEIMPEEEIKSFDFEFVLSKEEYRRFIKKGGLKWLKKELTPKKRKKRRKNKKVDNG